MHFHKCDEKEGDMIYCKRAVIRIGYITLLIFISILWGCTQIPQWVPFFGKNYTETVSGWKSYKDVVQWMEKDFSFDEERYKKYEGTLPPPRTSEETFKLRSGIYIDAASFLKETLNRINPSYDARIVVLVFRPSRFNHYVCSFKTGGHLFIMDYGTPYREVSGLLGPYRSLDEYKNFYEKHHPLQKKVEAVVYLK
jgi:hypothetical protein